MTEATNTNKGNAANSKGLAAVVTIFENDQFIVLNKPAGILSIPDRMQSEPSLKDMLIEKYGNIFTIHRLDKETSGIIIFAKDEATHKYFSKLFEEKRWRNFTWDWYMDTCRKNQAAWMVPSWSILFLKVRW